MQKKKKVKIDPTPEYMSRKNENINLKRYMHPNVLSSAVYYSQAMEAN